RMVRRVQKKSFQQSLEDIKDRMKEKRNKQLSSACAANRGINKTFILKNVQVNNKALALALQAEKEKVKQAQMVILQMKKEQHVLMLHLLMLKRKLKEHESLASTRVNLVSYVSPVSRSLCGSSEDNQSKPERGRKPDRAPLRRPWESSRSRARSKSRDRSKARPNPVPCDKLNTSLGSNDTFDFDCEESIHVTPFRALLEASSPAEDQDDSLYVPCRRSKRISSAGGERRHSPPCRARSKRRMLLEARQKLEKENVLPKRPVAQGTVSDYLFSFLCHNPCNVTDFPSSAFREFSAGRSRFSGTEHTLASDRKRRCIISVDYKEPTLNRKLRRGDKFTDTKFLRSPVFKQKSRRSMNKKPSLERYNESFVGCR
uniref:Shugoshin 1 n=1 Tax=Scleropages formosus TaxID=113540 RepID=A0A8C9U4V1_SCLFO